MDEQKQRENAGLNTLSPSNHVTHHELSASEQDGAKVNDKSIFVQGNGQQHAAVDHRDYSTNHHITKLGEPLGEQQKDLNHLRAEEINAPAQHSSSLGDMTSLELPNQFENNHQNSTGMVISGEATPQFDAPALFTGNMEQLLHQQHGSLSQEKVKYITVIPESEEPEETARGKAQTPPIRESQLQLQTATFSKPEDLNYRTTQQERNMQQEVYNSMQTRSINIETSSAEEIKSFREVTPVSINKELYVRLVKTGVIREYENKDSRSLAEIQESTSTQWELTSQQTINYLNGVLFGRYLVFLKKHMKRLWNQIWSIKVTVIKNLKQDNSEESRGQNWNFLNVELDKISITMKDETLEKLRKGLSTEVDAIFNRIERYSKIITDASFLKFEQVVEEDKYADDMDETTVYDQVAYTEENISEIISLRQNTMRSNASKATLTRKITRGLTKLSNNLTAPKGIKNPPEKSLTQMIGNSLRIRGQQSDQLNISNESPGTRPFMRIAQDFGSENMEIIQPEKEDLNVSPKPTSMLHTEFDVMNSRDDKQLHQSLNQAKLSLKNSHPEHPKQKKKIVKDGVDILNLDSNKPIAECDSSLELILVSLSTAFKMSPQQAAALLTNNNQYLITACIKGVKGGRYEPLQNWYQLLISNREALATLLRLEMDQLPGSAKQTFVKVMAAVGCGFFSYNIELVYMTFSLFTQLFDQFQASSMQTLQEALKWFLSQSPIKQASNQADITVASLIGDEKATNNQIDYVNAGGLKLSLYAIGKHREATKHAILLYNVLCQTDEQVYMIFGTEIQSQSKSTFEYMELVGEFLPIMAEIMPEKAIESGLVDYWLDLCSREAENELRLQNQEKVLAISLLAEIWLLFTDYIDEKEEVTNTLIFVFKRTVSERTKSIRILSIAYLFKVLEKLINLKKKAALTLYRTLIFSLVESPFDPTIRELYLNNFTDLYNSNPKIPIEWLTEPLLKQMQVQYGVTWVLKIFDLTFMMTLLDHPKFKEEQALKMYSFFAQVSLHDTSYCMAAQTIMLKTVERFFAAPVQTDFLQKLQEYVRSLFEQLNDLEPITRQVAQNQLQRQLKQKSLKVSSGSIGGRSIGQLNLQTPNLSLKPPLKVRDLLGSKQQQSGSNASLGGTIKGQNYQKEMLRKHRKSLAITHLLKLQALNIKDINSVFLKDLTFEKTREFKGIYGYFNKGHLEILKYYGEVQTLIQNHELDPQLAEQQRLEAQENNYGLKNNSRRSLGRQHNSLVALKTNIRAPSRGEISSDVRVASESREVALYSGPTEDQSRQVVPFQDNVNTRTSKSVAKAKAIQDLERIKKQKKDRQQQKEAELEKVRQASANRKKRARVEIEKRKKELGVEDRAFSQNHKLANQGQTDQQQENRLSLTFKTKQVVYVNLADEEERDRESVFEFMKKYQKLWRNIFSKYQNTGHKTNALRNPNFDQIQNKVAELSFAEITKLLKDHATYPRLINKDELSQMVRIVNQKSEEQRNDIQSLSYSGYQTFLIQLANHCFSRPPQDLSSQPMVKSMQALVTTFEEATRSRKLSTLLYEDPDAVIMSQKDKDLLKQLNDKVQDEPDYPLPDGFLKVKEKIPVFNHTVPKATVPFIGEAKAVCVELVDELLSKLFDFHVLEPIVTMEEKFRVKPSMQRSNQVQQITRGKDKTGGRAEALSIIRRAEERKANSEASQLNSRSNNRNNLPKIGQNLAKKVLTAKELPPIYKKIIKKQPEANREIYEETAVVLENIIRKVCGEEDLKKKDRRSSRAHAEETLSSRDSVPQSRDGPPKNLVKLMPLEENIDSNKYMERKALIDKQNAQEKRQKEKQRQERQKKLKQELAKLKEEKQIKGEEEEQLRIEEEKKKKELNQKLEEKRKKRLEEIKQEALNKQETKEEVLDPEAIAAKAEAERKLEKQKAKEKREFFRKQQEKLNNQFKAASEQRKAQNLQEQQDVIKKQQKKESLKRIIDQQTQQDNGHKERQLAADIVNFMAKQENKKVFAEHEKSLNKYFKYFCKQGRFEIGHDLQFRQEHLDFTSFNKMGLQSKIVPVLISTEQLKTTFRNSIKQFQLSQNVATADQEGPSAISQRTPSDLGSVVTTSQYIDYENFKRALVRIAIQGQELLGGQSEEQKQRKAGIDEKKKQAEQRKKELMKNRQEQRTRLESETLTEMRAEFAQKQRQILNVLSKSPSKAAKKLESVKSEGELQTSNDSASQVPIIEADFQRWLKQQDAIGNGLNSRVAEKMNKARPQPALKQLSVNNDLETSLKNVKNLDAEADLANVQGEDEGEDEEEGEDEGEVEENIGTTPLQRAKQNQAQQEKIQTSIPISDELDIDLISANTIKALFAFMHVEAGEEGEKSIDQVLAAQISKERRGKGANQIKRGVSKDPAAQTNQEQQRN